MLVRPTGGVAAARKGSGPGTSTGAGSGVSGGGSGSITVPPWVPPTATSTGQSSSSHGGGGSGGSSGGLTPAVAAAAAEVDEVLRALMDWHRFLLPLSLTGAARARAVDGGGAGAGGSGRVMSARPSLGVSPLLPLQDATSRGSATVRLSGPLRRQWKVLLHKKTCTFPLLMAAARSTLIAMDARVAAGLLSLLYNLLRTVPAVDRQRRATGLCMKLGLSKACGVVLRRYSGLPIDTNRNSKRLAPYEVCCVRACEAAGLLLAMAAGFDSKVGVVVRLSGDLQKLHRLAAYLATRVERHVATHTAETMRMSGSDTMGAPSLPRSSGTSVSGWDSPKSPTTRGQRRLMEDGAILLTALGNLCDALFALAKASANAQELGVPCVALCAHLIATVAPLHTVRSASAVVGTPSALQTEGMRGSRGMSAGRAGSSGASARLCGSGARRSWRLAVSHVLLWSLALLHRTGSEVSGRRRTVKTEAIPYDRVVPALHRLICRSRDYDDPLPWHCDSGGGMTAAHHNVHVDAALLALLALLQCDRARGISELREVGGLCAIVDHLLADGKDPSPERWHALYLRLSAMYGLRRLPAAVDVNSYAVNDRLANAQALHLEQRQQQNQRQQPSPPPAPENQTETGEVSAYTVSDRCLTPVETAISATPTTTQHSLTPEVRCEEDGVSPPRRATPTTEQSVHVDSVCNTTEACELPSSAPVDVAENKGRLTVDVHPEWFSPELHGGNVEEATSMAAVEAHHPVTFAWWSFPDPPPPPPSCIGGTSTLTAEPTSREDRPSSTSQPSAAPPPPPPLYECTPMEQVTIYKHHIARLRLLSEDAQDAGSVPHSHQVVFERGGDAVQLVGGCDLPLAASHANTVLSAEDDTSSSLHACSTSPSPEKETASVDDEATVSPPPTLRFFSDFESGNLQRAIRVAEDEYDLVLSWDTATNSYIQWFCFAVTHYTPGKTYRFNIVNMEKTDSTFNDGQQPLLLHVPQKNAPTPPAAVAAGLWERVGRCITYFENPYVRPPRAYLNRSGKPKKGAGITTAGTPATIASVIASSSLSSSARNRVTAGGQSVRRRPLAPAGTPAGGIKGTARNEKVIAAAAATGAQARRGKAVSSTSVTSTTTTAAAAQLAARKKALPAVKSIDVSRSTTPPAEVAVPLARFSDVTANGSATVYALPEGDQHYCTLTFTVTMPSQEGTVYFTNCYPYTYTHLRHCLDAAQQRQQKEATTKVKSLVVQSLCDSTGGLPIPLLTITALTHADSGLSYSPEEIYQRPVCLLTARVHPGESCSSWMMHGLLEFLLSPRPEQRATVEDLLRSFVFKILPMLNVDGVVAGNHRCSLVGMDLNRDYTSPSAVLNPVVYAIRRLLRHYTTTEQRRVVFCTDFHGHSRAKHFLLYGCTQQTMATLRRRRVRATRKGPRGGSGYDDIPSSVAPEKLFGLLLSQLDGAFSPTLSSFAVQAGKRAGGRITLYQQFRIRMSYAIEATMMGGRAAAASVDVTRSPSFSSFHTALSTEEETHYDETTYRRFGGSFLRALHALLHAEGDPTDGDGAEAFAGEWAAQQRAWQQLRTAGTDRALPSPETSVLATAFDTPVAAGPYAVATRRERRGLTPPGASLEHPSPPSPQSPPFPTFCFTPAQRHAMWQYLFRSTEGPTAALAEEDDGEEGVDGGGGSDSEDSCDEEDSTDNEPGGGGDDDRDDSVSEGATYHSHRASRRTTGPSCSPIATTAPPPTSLPLRQRRSQGQFGSAEEETEPPLSPRPVTDVPVLMVAPCRQSRTGRGGDGGDGRGRGQLAAADAAVEAAEDGDTEDEAELLSCTSLPSLSLSEDGDDDYDEFGDDGDDGALFDEDEEDDETDTPYSNEADDREARER